MAELINGTRLLTADAVSPAAEAIAVAAAILRQGGLVAFPTETVYGLGADALNPVAVEGIFRAKGRPADNPLIVHIADLSELSAVAASVPPLAPAVMARFWPGPLTLVLPKTPAVPAIVTAGLATVAVRMPDHPVALALIRAAGTPLAAPSANLSGRPSPTNARHVLDDLAGRIEAVVDSGETGIGLESTVLDLTGEVPLILRPGGLTREDLLTVLPEVHLDPGLSHASVAARSPGVKYKHYAPQAEVVVVEGSVQAIPACVLRLAAEAEQQGRRVGIIATRETSEHYPGKLVMVSGSREAPGTISHNLFTLLRRMDAAGVDLILAEGIADTGLGLAIMNRLRKAAGYRIIEAL